MATVPLGGRMVLRSDSGAIALRALRETELTGAWQVPVLAPLSALSAGEGVLELATPSGLFSAPVHVRADGDTLVLVPGRRGEPAIQQRRIDVRGRLTLPLRAAAADAATERALGDLVLEGVTLDVSAGGVGVDLHPRSGDALAGTRLYLELTLPDSSLVPAVVAVVQVADRRLHARFVDLAPVDREHLVRLVFEQQRADLAARARRRADG